jgi:hypothetical protein
LRSFLLSCSSCILLDTAAAMRESVLYLHPSKSAVIHDSETQAAHHSSIALSAERIPLPDLGTTSNLFINRQVPLLTPDLLLLLLDLRLNLRLAIRRAPCSRYEWLHGGSRRFHAGSDFPRGRCGTGCMPTADVVFGLFRFRFRVGVLGDDVDCVNNPWKPAKDEEEEVYE